MRSSLRNFLLAATILGCTALVSGGASATPTLVGTTTNPTGINGLVVDGTIYDVTFSTTTLNTFTTGSTLSIDASIALADALNALSVTELANTTVSDAYIVDVSNSLTSFNGAECGNLGCTLGWVSITSGVAISLGPFSPARDVTSYGVAADFTEVGTVGVPEPLTLSLFGAGLVGAAAIRRRKKVGA